MRVRRITAVLCMAGVMLFGAAAHADEAAEKEYALLCEGEKITSYAGAPEAGDEYIGQDNAHYRVTAVDETAGTVQLARVGVYPMPEVRFPEGDAFSVTSMRKAIALYCTHSDESYTPTDGKSSDEQRGGIYDVAAALADALEAKGVTVHQSTETHHPHDAGAYRRSRATAAALLKNGVDAVIDIHRDGIKDPAAYETKVKGDATTQVRLLVGRANQNASANKAFAAKLKAVADKTYPGLVKDIYIGKGTYNQDLMSRAVLLEFGTYTNDKDEVIKSTGYMADVLYRTLYGGVTGAAGSQSDVGYRNGASDGAEESAGTGAGLWWILGLAAVALVVFTLAQTGGGKAMFQKMGRTFQEMTGGALGGKKQK